MQNPIKQQKGDTLIEVMLAIAISAAVVIIIMSVMARGASTLQLSIERSQVRGHMEGQSSLLRYLRDQYAKNTPLGISEWEGKILKLKASSGFLNPDTVPGDLIVEGTCDRKAGVKAFYIDEASYEAKEYTGSASISSGSPIAIPNGGLWVEAYKVMYGYPGAVDLAIRSCWTPLGGGVLQQDVTVVRLYYGK